MKVKPSMNNMFGDKNRPTRRLKVNLNKRLLLAIAVLAWSMSVPIAHASDYPDRPIKITFLTRRFLELTNTFIGEPRTISGEINIIKPTCWTICIQKVSIAAWARGPTRRMKARVIPE